MKAAVLHQYDPKMEVQLKLEEVPAPTIDRPDDVIVRVGAAGLCRTDLHIIEGVWKDIVDTEVTVSPADRARQIAQESIIVDTHVDVPYRLYDAWEDVSVATEGGDFDYPRALAGGLNAPFMSIYTPAEL